MSRGAPQILGRYALHDEFARGGMAQLHYGTVLGDAAFQKTVAIKRLLPQLKADAEIVTMLIDEARMASRVSHPNVVSILDVIAEAGEVALVMPYVDAESLARLVAAARASGAGCPVPIASRIVHDVLLGLHAAHEAKDAAGQPLGLVHRDVSPENVLVGADGVARVADFGVAKARGKLVVTREGVVKGKLRYMAPEHFRGREVDRRADLYSAGVVLWELLAGEPLWAGAGEAQLGLKILNAAIAPPSARAAGVPAAVDAVVVRATSRRPEGRYATAREMAAALFEATPLASSDDVAAWVAAHAGDVIAARAAFIEGIERAGLASLGGAPEPSAISAPRDEPEAAPARPSEAPTRTVVAGLGVAAAVAAVVVVVAVVRASLGAEAGEEARVPAAAAASAALASAAPPASAEPPPPPASAAPASPPASQRSTPVIAAPRAPARTSSGARCDPPFTVDAAGRKHYKVECVRGQ
ncbi:MAG: serine/threonine protein kinase [Myxococcales bacterium]|nr:serine/threonine protein kinase [Myxococcales bacterium]